MRLSKIKKPFILYRWLVLFIVFLTLILSSACLLTGGNSLSQNATLDVVRFQQTQLSETGTALAELLMQGTNSVPTIAITPTLQASFTQAVPEVTIAIHAPEVTPENISIPEDVDERLMKSSKILVFEDMSASRHIRYVKEALDRDDYFYLDVGSATGWFKSQLLSSVEWDLIIAAGEARRDFGGEFFQFIDDHVAQGSAAIVEFWDWDAAPMGKQKSLLDHCGVSFQVDWFEPELRVFYWLDPGNPIFNEPNKIPNQLGNMERLWMGDIGDLFQIKYKNGEPTGDAIMLAGTSITYKDDHGVLVSCLDGRVILQGFSSHEYKHQDIVLLWQNYIYNALKNHYAVTGKIVPTPVATAQPLTGTTPNPSPTLQGSTPGSEYLLEHDCGGLMHARLMEAPLFQKDLFEHHAKGTFLIVKLELKNLTDFPIQIWDHDYAVIGNIGGKEIEYSPDKAATGYLYIEGSSNLSQDIIEPGESWRTRLAFDVDPAGKDWVLVVNPGKEFDQQVCEVRLPLSR